MAITTSYSLELVDALDLGGLDGVSDVSWLDSLSGFVVAGAAGSGTDCTIFDAAGEPRSSSGGTAGTDAAVTSIYPGDWVAVRDIGNDIAFSVQSADAATLGVTMNLGESGVDVLNADVAAINAGAFVIVYQKTFASGENDIKISIRNADGTVRSAFSVDASGANDEAPSVTSLGDGRFAVAWHREVGGETELWYAIYNDDGTVFRAPEAADTFGAVNRNAQIVGTGNGAFAIAYEDDGWTTGDIDITLARFDTSGVMIDIDDVSNNDTDDRSASLTLISNGLLALGSVTVGAEGGDPLWALIGDDGAIEATSQSGSSAADEEDVMLVAMTGGRFAGFFTDADAGEARGLVMSAVQTQTGDEADDDMIGSALRDIMYGGGGADSFLGGGSVDKLYGGSGDDRFELYGGQSTAGLVLNGGADFDSVIVHFNEDLGGASLASIERLVIHGSADAGSYPGSATVMAAQFGGGLAKNLVVEARSAADENLKVQLGAETMVNLSQLKFVNFDIADDRVYIFGGAGDDTIIGSSWIDIVNGGAGADRLRGGGGADKLRGGLGNDLYLVNKAGEAIEAAGQGTDTVRSTVAYTLGANLERLVLLGTGNIAGSGNSGANMLVGNAGDNRLKGRLGKDLLTGGDGNDRFQFDTALDGSANVDKILDFATGLDKISLDDAVFAGLTNAGRAAAFHVGTSAASAHDRIIYNPATGALFFDVDGKGGEAQVKFAVVTAGTDLVATDFIII
jgi:hypothetical protein